MKILAFIAVAFIVVVIGFAAGRVTKFSRMPVEKTARDFPALPAPPKFDAPLKTLPEKNIIVETPADGAAIGGTLVVNGRAKSADGAPVSIVVKNNKGEIIGEAAAPIVIPGSGANQYGRFSRAVELPAGLAGRGAVEIIWKNADDSAEEKVSRAVIFSAKGGINFDVYFLKEGAALGTGCGEVSAVARSTAGNGSIYRAALEALLRGPTAEERNEGYGTSAPAKFRLKSVDADDNGAVVADFDEYQGGETPDICRRETMRAQISSTLKQFPEVRDVVITIGGESGGDPF